MTAAYGKQRQSHAFTKANKTGTCRHVEILAIMAVHGAWQPSSIHSDSDKKALNFIPSLSSASQKNTGGTRTRRASPDRKRIEGCLPKEMKPRGQILGSRRPPARSLSLGERSVLRFTNAQSQHHAVSLNNSRTRLQSFGGVQGLAGARSISFKNNASSVSDWGESPATNSRRMLASKPSARSSET